MKFFFVNYIIIYRGTLDSKQKAISFIFLLSEPMLTLCFLMIRGEIYKLGPKLEYVILISEVVYKQNADGRRAHNNHD